VLARQFAARLSFLEKNIRNMQGMRQIEWENCIRALILILESPSAERGYEELKKFYYSKNMIKEHEAVDFLIREKFNGHSANIDKK
jgi:hypothetical protein